MPAALNHLEQYNHNKTLLNSQLFDIESTKFLDWVVTIIFYCAVHLIEKELATSECHSGGHVVRAKAITRAKQLRKISAQYATIYNQSRRARYECCQFSDKDIQKLVNLLYEIEKLILTKK